MGEDLTEAEVMEKTKLQRYEINKEIKRSEINKQYKRFYEKLKSAICLAGGDPDGEWNELTLERAFKELHPNGIYICFRLEPEKFYNKTFGPGGKM